MLSRQTGKTIMAVNHAKMAAIMKQGTYFMVFSTYNQAEQVVWKQYINQIEPSLIYKLNKDSLEVEFNYLDAEVQLMPDQPPIRVHHDPSKPRSRIRLLGSDQSDRHRGNKANGIVFDEYQSQNPAAFTEVYQPMFNTTDGWALFMGTPNGFNHFYDEVMRAQEHDDIFYLEATWRENPYIKPSTIEMIRKDYERKGQINAYLQEYELQFRKVDRAVYTEFDRTVHVIPPGEVPTEGTYWVTIDFGFVEDHPTAVNFVLEDDQGRWYVYDELRAVGTPLDDIIEIIKQRTSNVRLTGIVGDSARPDLIEYMQSKAMPVIPAQKRSGSVLSGIQLLKQKLHPKQQLMGPPKPDLVFTSNCKYTILDFEQYKYSEAAKDRAQTENPMKEFDDFPDGLRYLALHHKYATETKYDDFRPQRQTDSFGMPIY